jgi:hypothetical protein
VTSALVAPRRALPGAGFTAPLTRPTPGRRASHLRLVDAPANVHRHRRRRLVFAAMLSILMVLTVVAFHVELAQGQISLDHLGSRITSAQQAYERARLEHARLSAPARIVTRAGELGLTSPSQPPTPVTTPVDVASAPAGSKPLDSYGTAKPSLASIR